jgi:hypothetical protein
LELRLVSRGNNFPKYKEASETKCCKSLQCPSVQSQKPSDMEQAGVSQGIVERIVCSHAVRTYFSWNCACICGTARYSGNLSLLW